MEHGVRYFHEDMQVPPCENASLDMRAHLSVEKKQYGLL